MILNLNTKKNTRSRGQYGKRRLVHRVDLLKERLSMYCTLLIFLDGISKLDTHIIRQRCFNLEIKICCSKIATSMKRFIFYSKKLKKVPISGLKNNVRAQRGGDRLRNDLDFTWNKIKIRQWQNFGSEQLLCDLKIIFYHVGLTLEHV